MPRHLISTALISLALVGCAGTNFEWNKVRDLRVGMSEAEVITLLGSPTAVRSSAEGVTWAWANVNLFTAETRTVSVVFREGKVASVPQIPTSYK